MAVRPGVNVTSVAVPSRSNVGERVGTWFVAGITAAGPLAPSADRPVRSITEFIDRYGDRVSYGTLYDAVDMFFRLGGSAVHVSRVVGASATVATKTIKDRAGSPLDTLRFDAIGPGAWGASISIAIADGVTTNTFVITVSYSSVVKEISPELSTPADAVQWALSSNYIRVTDLASATAAPTNNPAVTSTTPLVGGSDDRAAITDTEWTAALARFSAAMGPGLVSCPTRVTSAAHVLTVAHGAAYNREALLDAADGASAATTVSLATTVRASVDDPYGALFGPWLTVPGVAAGTTRKIPPCAIAAGLISKQARLGSVNEPAAGLTRGLVPQALDFGQTPFTDAERQTLNNAGVNTFHRPYNTSSIVLYGYRTLDLTTAWRNLGNQLLRIYITDEALSLGEEFMFNQIDGRGVTISQFGGALSGVMQGHWAAGELYGETSDEAYNVDVGAGVNTPATIADGQLNANISCRMSEFAEQVNIVVVKYPLTESIA